MKSKSPLTVSLLLSLVASQVVIGADAKKTATKPVKAPAKAEAKAESKADSKAEAKTAEKKADDKKPAVALEIKDPVAVVDGVNVTKAELDTVLNTMLAQGGRTLADIPAEQQVNAYRSVLDDLIVDRLVTKLAAGVEVTDAQVEEAFKQATAGHSEEEIKEQIAKSGQTLEKIKAQIRTGLRQRQWVESQVKDKVEVTDAEAEAFYKKNPDQFKSPERVRASHILVAVKADATPDQVKEKEKAAQAIYERVTKGEDFAKLAKELSEDPSAKQNSGDLDFFGKEQMVPEFSAVAFTLKKDEISKPVRSQFGYHIIKATDHKDAEAITFEKAKPQLVGHLKQQKQRTEVQKLIADIRAKADVKINLPAPATPPVAAGAREEAVTAPQSAPPAETAPAPAAP